MSSRDKDPLASRSEQQEKGHEKQDQCELHSQASSGDSITMEADQSKKASDSEEAQHKGQQDLDLICKRKQMDLELQQTKAQAEDLMLGSKSTLEEDLTTLQSSSQHNLSSQYGYWRPISMSVASADSGFSSEGLWLYLAGSSLPCLTLIGSPNFGYRSVHRDLEAQIAIVTESRALQQQLHQEQEQLYVRSGVVSSATFDQPDRQVKLWVKMVTPLIKNFF